MTAAPSRWGLMVHALAGESVPPPPAPALPGRLIRQQWTAPDDEAQLRREQAAAVVWQALANEAQRP